MIDTEILKLAFNYGVPAVIALFLVGFMTVRINGKLEKNTVATQANTLQAALTNKTVEDNTRQTEKLTDAIGSLREEVRVSRVSRPS